MTGPGAWPAWYGEVTGVLARLARRPGGKHPAVIDGTTTLTFTELYAAARDTAPRIATRNGIAPIEARSSAGFVVHATAAWLAGCAPFPLPPHVPRSLAARLTANAARRPKGCRPWKVVASAATGRADRALVTHGEPPSSSRKALALGMRPGGSALIASPLYLNGPLEFTLRQLLLGGTVILAPRFTPPVWAAFARAHRPRWAFLVPTQIRRLLAALPPAVLTEAITGLDLLLHSSEPCPPALRRCLCGLLGGERVGEYYGAAEYDGTFRYASDPLPGAAPIPGAELRVVDHDRLPAAAGATGVIEGRSTAGIVSHPAGQDCLCPTAGSWRTVGDRGRLIMRGRLTVTSVAVPGRAIVGGINVALGQVSSVLLTHPAIADCRVKAVPDPGYGQVVAAEITAADPDLTTSQLHAYCATRLPKAACPRHVRLTYADPRSTDAPARM
jgi:acyl-CoA synthetase (AMP-forming)/AMP-acid ligase II